MDAQHHQVASQNSLVVSCPFPAKQSHHLSTLHTRTPSGNQAKIISITPNEHSPDVLGSNVLLSYRGNALLQIDKFKVTKKKIVKVMVMMY